MSGALGSDNASPLGGTRPTYALSGLPWGCSLARARANLESRSAITVGDATDDGVLHFESEESGYRVQRAAHFTYGALTKVIATCIREDDDAVDARRFFGEMSGLFLSLHGLNEPVPPFVDGKMVRQWPSDERGSLRMTLDMESGEIVILCHSGVHS